MFIEFSELNFKLLILLVFPLDKRIEDYVKKLYLKKDNFMFKIIVYFLSYIFSFIFILIFQRNNRNINTQNESNSNENDNKEENNKFENSRTISSVTDELNRIIVRRKKIKSFIFLAILCIISLSCYIYRRIFENKSYKLAKQSIGILFDISFFIVLSVLLLQQKLYKHNYVSLGVMSLLLLVFYIISTFYMDKENIFPSILYYMFYSLLFTIYDILIKKYMNVFYNTPYATMFVIGIIGSVCTIIFDIFAYFFNRDISGVIIGFQDNVTSFLYFLAFILHLITEFIWVLAIFLTIYYYSPCHFFISEYISEYISYMIAARDSNDDFYCTSNVIIYSISSAINFFFALVFNEVIILNFWNLDFNTKKRIRERMKSHDDSLIDNVMGLKDLDNSISDDNDSSNMNYYDIQ